MLKDEDLVAPLNGRHTMRNDDRRPVLTRLLQRDLNLLLAVLVQSRCRLVEHQHSRLTDDRSGDCDALFLATGELAASVACDGVETIVQHDVFQCLRALVDVAILVTERALSYLELVQEAEEPQLLFELVFAGLLLACFIITGRVLVEK